MSKKDYSQWEKKELIGEIEKLEKRKKYGLVWDQERTKEIFEKKAQNNLPVLHEEIQNRIISSPDEPTHIFIEGDNYHALSVLSYTHENLIDFIYIDPPYNIGEKDFRYNDYWVDKEDTYRHSKWLSFLAKRLRLAKGLLKNTGTIFISIDDNEVGQLKLLCNEIFYEKNFIAQLIHKNNSSKNQANLISVSTEYMLVYAKDLESIKNIKTQWRTEKKGVKEINKQYEKLKKEGKTPEEILIEIKELYKRPKYSHLSRWNKVDEIGIFIDADLSREGGSRDYTIINPETNSPCVIPERGWAKSLEELQRLQKENKIWYGDQSTPPRIKDYLTSDDKTVPDNFLYYDNSIDTRFIREMFGKLAFENPKPLEMIKFIITMATKQNSIILDFFAGSGTTGHAVQQLNFDEKSNRVFILCNSNENGIAREVCYPRISKVFTGYTDVKGINHNGLGGNLIYYTTDFVFSEESDENKEYLTHRSSEMLCLKENTFSLFSESQAWKIFSNNDHFTAILFDQLLIPEFKKELNKLDKPISAYIFSLEDDNFSSEFEDMKIKIKICSIPEAILRIYRRINK